MKKQIKHILMMLTLIIFSALSFTAQTKSDALPTLRGTEAVNNLKETGQYDSLMDAVNAARKENGQRDEPPTEDAVGQSAKLLASDGGASDLFGISVSISGETAIVGAYRDDVGANGDQGSAYVLVRSGTVWTQQAKLIASDGATSDQFGISVAISGETAIIGVYLDDVGANVDQGSAYVFVRSGAVWTQQAQLTAADGAADDNFGYSVSISGDTAIVGARFDDVGANGNQGSAYVFVRSGTVWTQQAQLIAPDGAADDNFGCNVSISGETAIVGAYGDDVGANANQGSAYVFVRTGTVWTQQAQLTAADGAANDQFGRSVAISGSNMIVGAVVDDVGANINQGSAYLFRNLSNTWTQEAQKVASDGAANDQFGYSVSISGETAIVGSYLDDVGANANQGSAYVFVRTGTVWTQQAQLTASDGAASDLFGWSAAISGDTAIVSARGDDVGANFDQGSAYVFVRSGTAWTQQAKLTAADGAPGDLFGASVSISGDTAIVGAQADDVGANGDQGSAYVFVRSGTAWTQQAQLIAPDGAVGDNFSFSVSISGETSIVGAILDDVGANTDQGSAYVFVRSGTTWTQQAQLTASDGAANDFFGWSVSISGETAIVGARGDDVGANGNQGSAYVFVRSGTAWTQQAKLTAAGGGASDNFGYSVAISGDKIIVGAPNSDASVSTPLTFGGKNQLVPQATDQGAMFVFVNAPFAPTAANVSVGGRVMTAAGAGVRNAIVYLTKPDGTTLSTRTGTFGYYRFDDLEAGETYVVTVISKRFSFAPQVIQANDNVTDADFIAQE